jgi:trehalose 6-phosphate synthase
MAEGKLIVVSNRLPLSVKRGPEGWVAEPSSGGLASAVNPILKQRGGLWIGWPGHAPR